MSTRDTSVSPADRAGSDAHHVSGLTLAFALLGAPFTWTVHLVVSAILTGYFCEQSPTSPAPTPTWSGLWTSLLVISVIAIGISVLAGYVSWRAWNKRSDRPSRLEYLLESGADSIQFLVSWGVLISGAFVVALLFPTIMLFLLPVCSF